MKSAPKKTVKSTRSLKKLSIEALEPRMLMDGASTPPPESNWDAQMEHVVEFAAKNTSLYTTLDLVTNGAGAVSLKDLLASGTSSINCCNQYPSHLPFAYGC